MLKITIELTGRAPFISHNGRLANPLDAATQAVAQVSRKRQKTPEDYRQLLPLEAYGGCYETKEGLLGLPTENVHSCLVEAARGFKQGTALSSALLFEGDTVTPLLVDGAAVDAREYVYNHSDKSLFIRTVVIAGRRTLRGRTIVRNWSTTHSFTLLEDVVNPNDLEKIFVRAGRLIGLGDWRPRYGTFTTRVVNTETIDEEAAA